MEALIVATAALAALILIEAGYSIAITLARSSPVIAVGILAGWLACLYGASYLEALGIGLVGSVLARHVLRQRFTKDRDFQ